MAKVQFSFLVGALAATYLGPHLGAMTSAQAQEPGQAKAAETMSDTQTATQPVVVKDNSDNAAFAKFGVFPEVAQNTADFTDIVAFMNSYSASNRGRTKVSYDAVGATGGRMLIKLIQDLQGVPVTTLSKPDQLAYWLNMRNLLVVLTVTVEKKDSLETVRGTFNEPGEPWRKKLITVEDVKVSIDDIERKIILANWDNPNIIYGLYQGFEGAPAIYKPGFKGVGLNDTLQKLGRRYVSSRRTVSAKKDEARVAGIYNWYYSSLFDGDEKVLRDHLISLSKTKAAKKLSATSTLTFVDVDYDVDEITVTDLSGQARARAPLAAGGGGFSGGAPRSGS